MKPIIIALLFLVATALATVPPAPPSSATFTCTGSVGPYPFTFPITDPTAMSVYQNGTLLASANYTIAPVNNNYNNGGNVTLSVACPSPQVLLLQRITPQTQTTKFYDNMPIPMSTFEKGLDKVTEITQDISATGVMHWKGVWSVSTIYTLNDAVSYNGSSYISLTYFNLGNTPGNSPTEWSLMSAGTSQILPTNGICYAASAVGADIGSQINTCITTLSTGGGAIWLSQGSYTLTTPVTFTANVVLNCAGPSNTTITINSAIWPFTFNAIGGFQVNHCGFSLGSSALGLFQVTNASHDFVFNDLYITGGSVTSTVFSISGGLTQYAGPGFFNKIRGSNYSGVFMGLDHTIDLFFTDMDTYGAHDNTTSQTLVMDSNTDGTQISNWSGGASGLHGLVVKNTHNTTTATTNISAGSNVNMTVANASVCAVGLKPSIDVDPNNPEIPTITAIAGNVITLGTVAHNHTSPFQVVCGQGPLWIFANTFISDCSTGGDAWLFDSSLNYAESGVLGTGYTFSNSWAAAAGTRCYSGFTSATPTANGVHISGGQFITITGGSKIRDNQFNGILLDASRNIIDNNVIISGNQISGSCQSDGTCDGIQMTTPMNNVQIEGNRINNDADLGHQKYAFRVTTSSFNKGLNFSGNTCNNNVTGCSSIPLVVGTYNAINNIADAIGVGPDNHILGAFGVNGNSGGGQTSTWLIPQNGVAANLQMGLCANVHFDGTNWIAASDLTNNGGNCILGNESGYIDMFVIPPNGTPTVPQTLSNSALAATRFFHADSTKRVFYGDLYQQNTAGNNVLFHMQSSFTSWPWNWPISVGTAGCPLLSQGGGTTAMTWASGFSGTKTAGTCVLTIVCGVITNVTGC